MVRAARSGLTCSMPTAFFGVMPFAIAYAKARAYSFSEADRLGFAHENVFFAFVGQDVFFRDSKAVFLI
jgi:hypothetical protein